MKHFIQTKKTKTSSPMSNQYKLNELLGINMMQDFIQKHKHDLKLKYVQNLDVDDAYSAWDMVTYSANTLPMCVEAKVNYWYSKKDITARIRVKKFNDLNSLLTSEKAKECGTQPYLFFFCMNCVWIFDLCKLRQAIIEKDPFVRRELMDENKTTAEYTTEQNKVMYWTFPANQFGTRHEYKPDYKQFRNLTLEQGKERWDRNLKWEDNRKEFQ